MSYPPTGLSVVVETPGGRFHRWADDEPRPENVPGELQFSTTIPGGFEEVSCSLSRRAEVGYADLEPLSDMRVLGADGSLRGEFRLEDAPSSSGESLGVSPRGVGWQAALEDSDNCSAVFVDRDLQAWTGPSAARREALASVSVDKIQDPSVDPDVTTGVPQLVLHNDGPCGSAMMSEAWFDSGPGNAIDSVYFDYVGRALGAGWSAHANNASDDVASAGTAGTDVVGGSVSPSGTRTETFATPRRYVYFNLGIASAQAGAGDRRMRLRKVAVWGSGVTKRGTAPDDGVYSSDAIAAILGRFVPSLRFSSTGPLPTIQQTGYVNPHLSFREPTTPLEMITKADLPHRWDWAVWEGQDGPTFYYYPPGGRGKRWRTRIGPSNLQQTGRSVSRVWNGIIVRYSDVDGTTLTVGPPGAQVNTTSTDLLDADPENPANQLGVPRYPTFEMNEVSTAAKATAVGKLVLERYSLLDQSGSASLVGWVEDDGGRLFPSSAVRAGDYIAFADASDPSDRRIVRTSYEHSTITNTIDLVAPPEGLDALLERMNLSIVSLNLQ